MKSYHGRWRLRRALFPSRGEALFAATISLILVTSVSVRPAAAEQLADIVEGIRDSIVAIGTFDPLRQPSMQMLATGFVVGNGNYVVTNQHVVTAYARGHSDGRLVVFSGRGSNVRVIEAEIAAQDQRHDLALLKLEEGNLNPVRLGSEELYLRDGTEIAITGYPIGPVLGLFPATHRGIVAAVTPNRIPQAQASDLAPEFIRSDRFLVYQLNLVAFPGNSGSPLYDTEDGTVFGIINSTFIQRTRETALSNPSGISYAVPVRYLHRMLRELDAE